MNKMDREFFSATTILNATIGSVAVATTLLLGTISNAESSVDPAVDGVDRVKVSAVQPSSTAETKAESITDDLAELMAGNTVAAQPGAHKSHGNVFVSQETVIRLESLEEVEIKARMSEGDTILYSWEAADPVYVDTHGEPFDYPQRPAVRYSEQDGVTSDNGRITAPMAGRHGWYWLNTNEGPITITLKTSGYYETLDEVYRNQQ